MNCGTLFFGGKQNQKRGEYLVVGVSEYFLPPGQVWDYAVLVMPQGRGKH